MAYEPLHHKYRPQTFGDLVGQEAIANTLVNAIEQEKIATAYLFTGPRGTGKTSSARILAKSLNCLASPKPTATPCGKCAVCQAIAAGTALDVIEIDAASNTGVDNIREIIERARFAPVQSRYKVYVIDECHMLSTAAFNALLKTLEEPPPQVVFILATTDPQRVLATIISRCQRFDYRRIPLQEMTSHLEYIAAEEKIAIAKPALTLVAQIANGGLRDAESLLDQLSLFPETVTVDRVWDLVGAVPEQDLLGLIGAIRSKNIEHILEKCRNLLDRGKEPLVVLQNLASFYLNLLIAKTSPQRNDLVAVTETCWQELQAEAVHWQMGAILQGQQQLKDAEVQLKNTTQPRLWLEVTLLGLVSHGDTSQETPTEPLLLRNSFTVETDKDTSGATPVGKTDLASRQPSDSALLTKVAHGGNPSIYSRKDRATSPPKVLHHAAERENTHPERAQEDEEMREHTVSQPQNLVSSKLTQSQTVAQMANSSSVAHTQQSSFSEIPKKKRFEPSTNTSSQPQVNQPATSQPITPISETKENSVTAIPTTDINQDLIWQKAIALVHPPTTRTLLFQKCHLINIQGSMVTIGVVSPQLIKLIQVKISNIETAFTQACQRKIKVTLEVAKNTPQPATSKSSPPSSKTEPNRSSQLPELEPETIKVPEIIPAANIQSLPPTTPSPKPQTKPVVTHENKRASNATQDSHLSVATADSPAIKDIQNPKVNEEVNIAHQDVTANTSSAGDFQKAVELLTKSFDGEVINLGNIEEDLPSKETAISDNLNPDTNQAQSVEQPTNPIRNRPDLTIYEDDDDVPF